MRTGMLSGVISRLSLLAALVVPLGGQGLEPTKKAHATQAWGPGLVVTCPPFFRIKEPFQIQKRGQPPREGPLPQGSHQPSGAAYARERFWAVSTLLKEETSLLIFKHHRWISVLWESQDGAQWRERAAIDNGGGFAEHLLPLEDGLSFLGFAPTHGFLKEGRRSPLAVFRQKGTMTDHRPTLELDRLIELEAQRLPLYAPVSWKAFGGKGHDFKPMRPVPARQACDDWYSAPIPCGDHFVFLSQRTGHLWILDGRSGEVRRQKELFNLKEPDLGDRSTLIRGVLAVQPTEEGTLLIAARDLKAVEASAGRAPELRPLGLREQMAGWKKREEEGLKNPTVRWWELDVDTGKLLPASPPGALETLESIEQLQAFHFKLDARGQLYGSWQKPRSPRQP